MCPIYLGQSVHQRLVRHYYHLDQLEGSCLNLDYEQPWWKMALFNEDKKVFSEIRVVDPFRLQIQGRYQALDHDETYVTVTLCVQKWCRDVSGKGATQNNVFLFTNWAARGTILTPIHMGLSGPDKSMGNKGWLRNPVEGLPPACVIG